MLDQLDGLEDDTGDGRVRESVRAEDELRANELLVPASEDLLPELDVGRGGFCRLRV